MGSWPLVRSTRIPVLVVVAHLVCVVNGGGGQDGYTRRNGCVLAVVAVVPMVFQIVIVMLKFQKLAKFFKRKIEMLVTSLLLWW